MKLLNDNDALFIRDLFNKKLKREVKVILFTAEKGCQYCKETEQLLKEISAQSKNNMKVEVLDLDRNREFTEELKIDAAPATVVLSSNGTKLYYFGMPGGYQLKCLIEDIVDASEASTDLASNVKERIKKIDKPVDIKVFVTPACPYSPIVVRAAHRFAIENPLIRAQMIESIEFNDLTRKYNVMGVPKTIINGTLQFEGVLSDEAFALKVSEAGETPLQ
ncbi:MAG: protein disulfide oxidoreductase [Nitrososphaerales archaeon]